MEWWIQGEKIVQYSSSKIQAPIFPLFHYSILPGRRGKVMISVSPLTLAECHKPQSSGSKFAAADDVDNQPETENSGNYVTDDSQGGKAEE